MNKNTLYFDGNCPICTAEVDRLGKLTSGNLVLKNIHDIDQDETIPDIPTLLSRLHLRTTNGEWLTGLDANIKAWEHTPCATYWKMLNWPVIRIFSHCAYEYWLRLRKSA
jgi:predicted DCC family thiol-disulfide oxidoreductase YuxK